VWAVLSVPLGRIFWAHVGAVDHHLEGSAAPEEVLNSRREQRHQVSAALLGIEAAAYGLGHHRAFLTEPECEQLSDGLVAEIHRLRSLIDLQHREPVTRFDLREAIAPVLSCITASGVELIDTVPAGIEVVGVPSMTVEACATVLRNALDHAPGSTIEVRAEVDREVASLLVEDRGPGFEPGIADAVFERGVRSPASRGSGLGLCIARRLMEEQEGSIRADARPGGGASVVLELPLARAAALVPA
jgi:signal transduction histidine kinase